MRVPYYIGDLKRDPILENYPSVNGVALEVQGLPRGFTCQKFVEPSRQQFTFTVFRFVPTL